MVTVLHSTGSSLVNERKIHLLIPMVMTGRSLEQWFLEFVRVVHCCQISKFKLMKMDECACFLLNLKESDF